MASSSRLDLAWLQKRPVGQGFLEMSQSTIAVTLAALVLVPVIASYIFAGRKGGQEIPLMNPPGPFELAFSKGVQFPQQGLELYNKARKLFPGQPVKFITNIGTLTILPPDRAQEVKGIRSLDFRKSFSYSAPLSAPGGAALSTFDHPNEILQTVVSKYLTKRLNTVTGPLATEATFTINKDFGNSPDWTEVKMHDVGLDVVARLSSRVFLGSEICRNEEWLELTKRITIVLNTVLQTARVYPSWLRPLVYRFGKHGRDMMAVTKRVNDIVNPIIEKRKIEKAECEARGEPAPVYNDAIEWILSEHDPNDRVFEVADFQIALSVAAVHTTSDLLSHTMLTLAANPQHIEPLRKEIIQVLGTGGWKKTSLTSLRLLDSAVKEAQRLKPVQNVSMQRLVTEDTTIEGGYTLRKGELVGVDTHPLRDPAKWPEPETFDPYRFYKARKQPGGEHKAQLVSVSPDHLTFGYGKHACPGRFFAANEVKLALCHLLLKYDWKLPEGGSAQPIMYGLDPMVNPGATVMFRRRKEELDLDSLLVDSEV
ncbi:hypothetical protein PoMZ_10833 [Pyricularia oryzae]|uniref:Ent-kaurene oxidase n=1 Tax=Pyricularia oryzae TaxID=318829 RepID=A0A4P7NIY9_PYROR|nr:hypothetical protein PoMZ_10833 [Pyricularia oryzae]